MTSGVTPGSGPVTVRRAVAKDAKRLTRLVRGSRAYEGRYAAVVADHRVGRGYIEAHRVFVAVGGHGDGARVLGFYSLLLAPRELDLLFVADEAQGRGIGRLLVTHMLAEARAAGLDGVRVVSHPPAEGFYRSVGAVRTGTAPPNPPAVGWERPEFDFFLVPPGPPAPPNRAQDGSGAGPCAGGGRNQARAVSSSSRPSSVPSSRAP